MSSFPEFESFFREAWGVAPFPWQQRLADRVQQGLWPGGISLPTASGKTACIDIAVWALAAQAGRPPEERSAPRRIVFVIDRRVVVDEAWERARTLAARLREAASGPLSQVAARLRTLSNGYGEPLTVHRLRGGTLRDESWLRTPEQPAILLSTVDQVGSRLLFRGYGVSPRMAPIHAGLLAHDTLLVLDEAHCAEPFAETLRAIARLRQVAEAPLPSPFQLVVMSATLPPGTSDSLGVEATDLADPVLGRRLSAAKPARLVVAREAKGEGAERLLAEAMAREAESLLGSGHDAVAVMVNRILTARAVHALLEKEKGWDAVLLIGRMRPLDRDALLERWRPLLAAISGGREKLARPVVVVATQTLEVGANLDFSGLVTEAAPIDSLRQRFGRLNRLGESERAAGVVVVRADQAKKSDDDPVYGDALAATWRWLVEEGGKKGVVDFGVEALDDRLAKLDGDAMRSLLAPTSPAPTLLPAHLDLLAQTSPIPEPEPDISLFLHGTRRASPEVQIVWRADLGGLPPEEQPGAVALLPPTVGESLSTPLWLARKWLRGSRAAALLSDLEGELSSEAREETEPSQKVLVWRGADDCGEVTANQLRPGDTLILPVEAGGFDLFGHVPADRPRDLAEEAFQAARDRVILRAHPAVLEPWRKAASVADLLALAVEPPGEIEPATLRETLQRVADADVPDWLRR
ncbi:MAG: type I-U CRISPR-associated helicase/endonuclease Cas3, partial [Acidobacteriota bacterium]|nr:type I-U CRISPR-associated helicase/endonuclease Cas3 [Acidobacteriota bacterium]